MNDPHRIATEKPDFAGVNAWVFDLDHTLYTMDAGQQDEMEERICRYVQRHYGLERDAAWEVQKAYLRDYGSTLAGLIHNERIDPDAYHEAINDIDVLDLKPDAALRAGLARLPGRRFVFTNNDGRFAAGVLARLAVGDLFDDIVDARAMDFVPKPKPAAYAALLARTGLDPAHAALFDDSARNLIPAHAMGMKTVWFNNGLGQSYWNIERPELHIDHRTDNLAAFLQTIRI
ncbi:MAG: pyrimidine 5'-nucleotidase [Rhizomicrobium sp.]